MVDRRQRQKLTDAFRREPLASAVITVKCAAGLLAVAGLAIVGAPTDATDAKIAAAGRQPWLAHEKPALAHAKALYQQRQVRLASTPPEAGIEMTAAKAANISDPHHKSNLMAPASALKN